MSDQNSDLSKYLAALSEVEDEAIRVVGREAIMEIAATTTTAELDNVRVATLGKNGKITILFKELKNHPAALRVEKARSANTVKEIVSTSVADWRETLVVIEMDKKLESEKVDVTLPVPLPPAEQGRIHPNSQVLDEVIAIFADMGFDVKEGPDIETDEHNFTALNIPAEHPARQMHDTFYFHEQEDGSRLLLRTHTSPVQIRTMRNERPPHRCIIPGRTYRCDSDQTHTPMFHQIEGLVVDTETHMGHLRWTLEEFAKAFFEVESVEMRFRPSYFPFTEPSMEVDIRCDRSGNEIKIGQGDDWLEILGCGMVHPNVLTNCGLDPAEYQGFAFGMGLDRIAMLKYGAPDLRAFFDGDLRWLRHYGFSALDVPSLYGGLSK